MYNLVTNPIIETEPITVDFFKKYARLSDNDDDEVLAMFISAARANAENFCRTNFITKVKTVKYPINVNLPAIAEEDIISIGGAYTTLAEAQNAYYTFVEYVKGFTINRDLPIDFLNLPTYTVTYVARVTSVPADVKTAICKIASDLNENKENSTSLSNNALTFDVIKLLKPYQIELA